MSGTATDTAPAAQTEHPWGNQPAPEPTDGPTQAADTGGTSDTPPTTEAPVAPPTEPTEPPKKPSQGDRRFAHLTARYNAEKTRADEAERRAAAAQALLDAAKAGTQPAATPTAPATVAATESVEEAASRLIAQRESDNLRMSVITDGRKEYGQDGWGEKADVLHSMGATENKAFMDALIHIPGGHKVAAHYADDVDALDSLLKKSPAAIAAEMGRVSARLEAPPAPAKPQSNAPRPGRPLEAASAVPEPTPYDSKMSMAEYVALRRKTAKPNLR